MLLIDSWKLVVLERYAKFDGRARRREYWWFLLANIIVFVALAILAGISDLFVLLYVVYAIAVFIPSLAVAIRRLHDTDRSGWWLLIAFVPFVGTIILIVLLALDSSRGTNQYGISEKYPAG